MCLVSRFCTHNVIRQIVPHIDNSISISKKNLRRSYLARFFCSLKSCLQLLEQVMQLNLVLLPSHIYQIAYSIFNYKFQSYIPSNSLIMQVFRRSAYFKWLIFDSNLVDFFVPSPRLRHPIIWCLGQVNKSGYFASANDVIMTTITKLKPQVGFQYGFRSFLQHRNTVNRLLQ